MTSQKLTLSPTTLKRWAVGLGSIAALFLALLILASLASGYGLNLRRFASAMKGLSMALADNSNVVRYSRGDFTNIIFLHQSVGKNLIQFGDLHTAFSQAGYDFWDHGYNDWGLRRPDNSRTGYSFLVPEDNTEPDGLANIFAQPIYSWPVNTLSALMRYEVIIIKSCYPASQIDDAQELEQYKTWYRQMRDFWDQHPEKLFIALTPPPLNPVATDLAAAARAREFAAWLSSDEFIQGHSPRHPNVAVFDFAGLLIETDPAAPDFNMLREDYRDGSDSHPNQLANETIAPIFVEFVIQSIQAYRSLTMP